MQPELVLPQPYSKGNDWELEAISIMKSSATWFVDSGSNLSEWWRHWMMFHIFNKDADMVEKFCAEFEEDRTWEAFRLMLS